MGRGLRGWRRQSVNTLHHFRRILLPEEFFSLSRRNRQDLLTIAAEDLSRPMIMLEKDIWVVQTLDVLFSVAIGQHLVFKGGTSLSKAYGVIHRFSEDIDVTVDIRQLLPEETSSSVFPPSRNQAGKWRDRIEDQAARVDRKRNKPTT